MNEGTFSARTDCIRRRKKAITENEKRESDERSNIKRIKKEKGNKRTKKREENENKRNKEHQKKRREINQVYASQSTEVCTDRSGTSFRRSASWAEIFSPRLGYPEENEEEAEDMEWKTRTRSS